MALGVKFAAVNTAADAYSAALDDLMDGLNAGDKIMFLPIDCNPGVASTSATQGFSSTPALQHRIGYTIPISTSNGANIFAIPDPGGIYAATLGRLPLVWKVTDDAGAIT